MDRHLTARLSDLRRQRRNNEQQVRALLTALDRAEQDRDSLDRQIDQALDDAREDA